MVRPRPGSSTGARVSSTKSRGEVFRISTRRAWTGRSSRGGIANPIGERRAVEREPLAGVDLRLAVERQMVGIFADEDMGDHGLGRQAAATRRLGAGAWTTPSVQPRQAYFGRRVTSTRNWAGMTSSRSETSSPITCSGAAAAGAGVALRFDHHLDPGQMLRQRAAVGPALDADARGPVSVASAAS